MKLEWKKMNGIQLFTKEWFVVLVIITTIGGLLMLHYAESL
jgi:hypothetical protein